MNTIEQKFREIKEQYNNAILFFKIGDYYNCYYEDSKTVGLYCWFAYEHKGILICSVPRNCIDDCVNKLESLGYSIEIIREE